ncbi:MAG: permease prefix domain 1-containing protein [Pseudonocardia sp.]
MTTAADPVAAHVDELRRVLHGPDSVKRSMIAEVRDGLRDAAAAYRDGGLDPHRAAHHAVRDFGTAREVAPLLQEELTARQGRATALLLVLAFPGLQLGWSLVWMHGVTWWTTAPPAMVGLARLQDVSSVVVGIAGLALLVATFRRGVAPRWVTALAGTTATIGAVVCGATATVMNVASGDQAVRVLTTEPLAVIAVVASGVMLALVIRSAARSLRAAHATGRSDEGSDPQVG